MIEIAAGIFVVGFCIVVGCLGVIAFVNLIAGAFNPPQDDSHVRNTTNTL